MPPPRRRRAGSRVRAGRPEQHGQRGRTGRRGRLGVDAQRGARPGQPVRGQLTARGGHRRHQRHPGAHAHHHARDDDPPRRGSGRPGLPGRQAHAEGARRAPRRDEQARGAPVDPPGRDPHRRTDHEPGRRAEQPGRRGAQAPLLLPVQRAEQHRAEVAAGERGERGDGGGGEGTVQQRRADGERPPDEDRGEHRAGERRHQRAGVREVPALAAAREAVQQQGQSGRERQQTGQVQPGPGGAGGGRGVLRQQARREDQGQGADGQVDQEDPVPGGGVDQPPAEHRSGDRADQDRQPQPGHRAAEPGPVGDPHAHRHADRLEQSAAQPLHRAEGGQTGRVPGADGVSAFLRAYRAG